MFGYCFGYHVILYGTQTQFGEFLFSFEFGYRVILYGTQTAGCIRIIGLLFGYRVILYGTQTRSPLTGKCSTFGYRVILYSIQTSNSIFRNYTIFCEWSCPHISAAKSAVTHRDFPIFYCRSWDSNPYVLSDSGF